MRVGGVDPHPMYEVAFKVGDAAIFDEWQILDEDDLGFDLSGGTFAAQLRTFPESPTVAATLIVESFDDVDGVESLIEVSISSASSGALAAGRYEWDVEWDGGDGPQTVLGGVAYAHADVTRSS